MPRVTVTVDGARYTDDVPARTLLVHYLRDQLGKIGTVVGCDTGNCGACTVHLTDPGPDSDGVPRAVKSCSVLAVQADGAKVSTVESLGGDHPMQRAFHEQHALQCGFCTPGMMMAAVDLLRDNPDPTDAEIREGLEGNLCRCTGYQNIVRAVRAAAAEMRHGSQEKPAEALADTEVTV
jgi:carbon-monoxide dehydrogenase small subunit